MKKFRVGEWVRTKNFDHRGVVRGHRQQSTMVCWIGTKKATAFATKNLKRASRPTALVLEGSLDNDLASLRSEEDLLRTWFRSIDLPLAYKNVHSISDLRLLARAVRGSPPPFVHVSCHGAHDESGRAYIVLAPRARKADRVYLDDPETLSAFEKAFGGLAVLFSACLLGRYQNEMAAFRAGAKLANVAAFTREVYDYETMLFELMLYQGVLINGSNFTTAVDNACEAMALLKVRGAQGKYQKLVRVF